MVSVVRWQRLLLQNWQDRDVFDSHAVLLLVPALQLAGRTSSIATCSAGHARRTRFTAHARSCHQAHPAFDGLSVSSLQSHMVASFSSETEAEMVVRCSATGDASRRRVLSGLSQSGRPPLSPSCEPKSGGRAELAAVHCLWIDEGRSSYPYPCPGFHRRPRPFTVVIPCIDPAVCVGARRFWRRAGLAFVVVLCSWETLSRESRSALFPCLQ